MALVGFAYLGKDEAGRGAGNWARVCLHLCKNTHAEGTGRQARLGEGRWT